LSSKRTYDFAIIGGGLVGLATAWAIRNRHPDASIVLIEKETDVAQHQSGRNSGVLHSGIYYQRGSLKADLTARGRKAMLDFCDRNGIKYEICGKLILATDENGLPELNKLFQKAKENGIEVKLLEAEEMREVEPHSGGIKGIWIPETGVVDFTGVARALVELLSDNGVAFKLGTTVVGIDSHAADLKLRTNDGHIEARRAINCAGLFSDRLARKAGVDPGLRIVPFRGEYFKLKPKVRHLVRSLIYPLADPRLPFLGVHLTRTIDGEVLAGPNAVFALQREGYHAGDVRIRDVIDSLIYSGFWRLAQKHLKSGFGEMLKAWSQSTFARAAQKLVPELTRWDLEPARAGVRAQAVDPNGNLVDDFRFVHNEKWLHVLNAPSPAATASLAIGELIAELIDSARM